MMKINFIQMSGEKKQKRVSSVKLTRKNSNTAKIYSCNESSLHDSDIDPKLTRTQSCRPSISIVSLYLLYTSIIDIYSFIG